MYATIHCTHGVQDKYKFMTSKVVTTALTQYHVSKGITLYGQEGIAAGLKELKQLHDMLVIYPIAY